MIFRHLWQYLNNGTDGKYFIDEAEAVRGWESRRQSIWREVSLHGVKAIEQKRYG